MYDYMIIKLLLFILRILVFETNTSNRIKRQNEYHKLLEQIREETISDLWRNR